MLGPLTHPVACLVYFAALGVGLHRMLGDPRGTLGFLGRGSLFTVACLAVFAAATLCGSYQIGGAPPVAAFGPYMTLIIILVPGSLAVILALGALAAAAARRPRPVFIATSSAIATMLFLLLWRMQI